MEALERAVRQQVLELAARAVEHHLNQDRSDTAPAQNCPCGEQARYAGRRTKRFQTVLGEMRLQRAYYCCRNCGHGFCPRDQELGLEGQSYSAALARMVAITASSVSFQEGSDLLSELAGVSVSAKEVERWGEGLGEEIIRYEQEVVEPEAETPLPQTLYLGMDGTGLPMRPTEVQGRAGKQPDGSARTRESKLCAVWSAEKQDPEGRPVRDPGSVTYTAAIESAATKDTDEQLSDFAQRVEREGQRRRFGQAPRQVVLGDGAKWIWNLTEELFPKAIQIVDRYHALERLHQVSKHLSLDEDARQAWVQRRRQELEAGQIDALLTALAPHTERQDEIKQASGYFRDNRHRMNYAQFRRQGLCTSSGVLEAGCKNVLGARLKRSGMHWTVRGANAITALRCTRLSGRFEDFWEWRADLRVAA